MSLADHLADVTAGVSVTRAANDDDEFCHLVGELMEYGHDRTDAEKALSDWIEATPRWDCPECGLENIDTAGFPACPSCDTLHPDVVYTTPETSA